MAQAAVRKRDVQKAADIVRDAGGRVVGRTRLQKIAYLLELAGVGDGFSFEYRHYGPYSEGLATAVRNATLLGLLSEEERAAGWGGSYSVFSTEDQMPTGALPARHELVRIAADADPILLELAATAAFLSACGERDPWSETKLRKPEKAREGRLQKAKALYRKLRRIDTPEPLPDIV